jgi:ketosteroid isomerase-like protein
MADVHDDEYAINLAQTQFRDAINRGDVDCAMTVIAANVTWMRNGEPTYWGEEGRRAIRLWVCRFIAEKGEVDITPINTRILGDTAIITGWEKSRLGGDPETAYRFFQVWERSVDGSWKMSVYISNKDVAPRLLEDDA